MNNCNCEMRRAYFTTVSLQGGKVNTTLKQHKMLLIPGP